MVVVVVVVSANPLVMVAVSAQLFGTGLSDGIGSVVRFAR